MRVVMIPDSDLDMIQVKPECVFAATDPKTGRATIYEFRRVIAAEPPVLFVRQGHVKAAH